MFEVAGATIHSLKDGFFTVFPLLYGCEVDGAVRVCLGPESEDREPGFLSSRYALEVGSGGAGSKFEGRRFLDSDRSDTIERVFFFVSVLLGAGGAISSGGSSGIGGGGG